METLSSVGEKAILYKVPNIGRDIGPLLTLLGKKLDAEYDIYGHIHTKKSELIDMRTADVWRDFLLTNLIGDKNNKMIDKIIWAMDNDEELGLVFPDDPGCIGWSKNKKIADKIAKDIKLTNIPNEIDFPVGTMFWAKKGSLSRLYKRNYRWEDYPIEPIGYDGTFLHAIERLLPQICIASGKTYGLTRVENKNR